MSEIKKFSWTARTRSFRYALAGLQQFVRGEHNTWIHLVATVLVIILSIRLRVTGPEAIAVVIVTGLVWMAELFNTAIEKIMDFVSVKEHPSIRFIKDVAAAAVLVAAITALVTGCILFIPKL